MNKLTNGTQYRDTPAGVIAIRGNRTLHLLGKSVAASERGRQLLATTSFDRLFRTARKAPGVKNTAFIKLVEA